MEDFFTGVNRTVLRGEELLYRINVPVPDERREASYKRVARTVVDIALVSAAVSVTESEGRISDTRVSLGSVAPVPIRAPEAERMLTGCEPSGIGEDTLARAGQAAAAAAAPISDVRAGADYRRKMCAVLTRRALTDSLDRLNGAGG